MFFFFKTFPLYDFLYRSLSASRKTTNISGVSAGATEGIVGKMNGKDRSEDEELILARRCGFLP